MKFAGLTSGMVCFWRAREDLILNIKSTPAGLLYACLWPLCARGPRSLKCGPSKDWTTGVSRASLKHGVFWSIFMVWTRLKSPGISRTWSLRSQQVHPSGLDIRVGALCTERGRVPGQLEMNDKRSGQIGYRLDVRMNMLTAAPFITSRGIAPSREWA